MIRGVSLDALMAYAKSVHVKSLIISLALCVFVPECMAYLEFCVPVWPLYRFDT